MQNPPSPKNPQAESASIERSRFGLLLFGIYLAFYLVFVFASAFACDWFETIVAAGLNLAVVYGFGLIILALVLSVVYGGVRRT